MLSFLNPYMLYIKLGAVVLALGGAAYAGHYVTKAVDDRAYSKLELAQSKADTKSVQDSLAQLQGFITTMDAAGGDYTAALATIKAQFATIQKELHNATLKPLPADCRPDAGRLRVLTDAVNATRQGSEPAK
jgi:hypothetical protein